MTDSDWGTRLQNKDSSQSTQDNSEPLFGVQSCTEGAVLTDGITRYSRNAENPTKHKNDK